MKKLNTYLKYMIPKNKVSFVYFLALVVSLVWLKEMNYLFYSMLESPDFDKNYVYLEHFFTESTSGKDNGLMYYFLQSLNYSNFYGDLNNSNLFLDQSIQQVNFYIFIFGLLGYYLLFELFNFSKNTIFLTLIFINFFPPSIALRLVFKPEILAFAFFPWIVYLIEKFIKEGDYKYLILATPFLASTMTLKGNVLVVIGVYLFITYIILFKLLPARKILILLTLFLFSFSTLTIENNKNNGVNILDIQSGSSIEANYDYKASYSTIYKVDLYNLVSSPIKHGHANSFIGITLLETTGDYFDLYWNNDASGYSKSRKDLIKFKQSMTIKPPDIDSKQSSLIIYQQDDRDVYVYETIGLLISILLYFYLIKGILKNSTHRKFLTAALIGMAILLFHSITGIPKNNFDPLVGDTFKPLYYSFVMIFSFAFLIICYLKNRTFGFLFVFTYVLIVIFLMGFPKNYNYEVQVDLVPKIQNSLFCNFERDYYLSNSDFENLNCKTKVQENLNSYEEVGVLSMIFGKPINFLFLMINFISGAYLVLEKRIFKKR